MYLDDIGVVIRKHVPDGHLPTDDLTMLFRLYALLLRAKGTAVTDLDVHNAWSTWMSERDPNHASVVEYDKLEAGVRAEDHVFTRAIHMAADELKHGDCKSNFYEVLYPSGLPKAIEQSAQMLELYKLIVNSSEALVNRRQSVNTFFITINGALLTAYGLVAQNVGTFRLSGAALIVIAVAGVVLCLAWRSLIRSFGQLNKGKFKVINAIEKSLAVSIYAAEWEALGRGEDPKVYRSFTSREIWVPNALMAMHILAVIVAGFVLFRHVEKNDSSSDPKMNISTSTLVSSSSKPTSRYLMHQ